MIEKIENVKLNLEFYSGKDLYSDGEIEDELLEICKAGNIEHALETSNKWPILYHLSNIRENLLEWYSFKDNSSVLEIGSGCGALTGLFCEKVEKVTCIELSKKRSMINAYKNKKYSNLEIYVGNFENIILEEKFDYITLIGVLEYSPSYINSKKPFHDFLLKIKSLLKPEGKIIIGIENKYGLKYISGAYEDHTGTLFSGIEEYKDFDHVRTFTRKEIINILDDMGLNKYEFYYPMPDYKMPKFIFSDNHKYNIGDMRNISQLYDNDCYHFFTEEIVFDNLCKNNMFPEFANSFLIFCESNEDME